ncbi:MAG: sensor histidine kinase [Steroidobacteraceae bacterium]|jgi:two-component system, LuxR family, sensor kinase FixL
MSSDRVRETPPAPKATGDGVPVAPDPLAVLHGRLLNVSRMATIGEMAAGVAHELNQPLTAIANYAHACERLLTRPGTDPNELREALRQIAAQTTRAADIIRRLRDLARGRQNERLPVEVNALVEELRELMRTDASLHGVELTFDLAPGLPDVAADAGQIQQVVLNFLRNSLEALTAQPVAHPSIAISTAVADGHGVQLMVCDNGPGLSSEMTKRVFDPFFSTKENGTGLGLAISSTIARAHGGTVGYRGNTPSGACFYIVLPSQPNE